MNQINSYKNCIFKKVLSAEHLPSFLSFKNKRKYLCVIYLSHGLSIYLALRVFNYTAFSIDPPIFYDFYRSTEKTHKSDLLLAPK